MSEYDVRHGNVSVIDCIRFADEVDGINVIANTLALNKDHRDRVELRDCDYDIDDGNGYVIIANVQHAEQLISALNKAIELKWLK